MQDVKIADLKSRLSHYLRLVRAGETVMVFDRNMPVARIVPAAAQDRRGRRERPARGPEATLMTAYLESSTVLRRLLKQPETLRLRTLDRLYVEKKYSEGDLVNLREALYRILATMEIVEVSRTVLARAAQPSPVSLGTLDAIHLSSAMAWRNRTGTNPVVATHDVALAMASRAQGFRVLGA